MNLRDIPDRPRQPPDHGRTTRKKARPDLAGKKFNRLLVIEFAGHNKHGWATWRCQCDCGKETVLHTARLTHGLTKSCGCLLADYRKSIAGRFMGPPMPPRMLKRKARTPLQSVWRNMIDRCLNPKNKVYSYYGGRGITVCERWRTFANFAADIVAIIGERPHALTLDRIDNNKGYEAGNVRWATRREQTINRRPPHEWPSRSKGQS